MKLINGDCLELLKTLEASSIDSLVTDPPAGISFMGKSWDDDKGGRKQWIAWMTEVMSECLRVMKPGAHGLVWALPRTSHWTASALEDAGFEIRDVVTHLFGQGFPKSLDVSKAIDKAAGAEREILSSKARPITLVYKHSGIHDIEELRHIAETTPDRILYKGETARSIYARCERLLYEPMHDTAPATDSAKEWQGWGTALKPASEHWILIRKPCSEKTVAANVLKWGTGAINIDGSRVETSDSLNGGAYAKNGSVRSDDWGKSNGFRRDKGLEFKQPQGRFPANLVLSDDAVEMLGEYSRFFYCAKISSSERNAGLEDMPDKHGVRHLDGGEWSVNKTAKNGVQERLPTKNHHPTVKPQKLMRYLIKMITPPNGVVLDPFMGSGSTGLAAKSEGFKFIGIEKEIEYFEIAMKRIGVEYPDFGV